MKLQIANKITVGELQRQFSAEFPYLKVEFFNVPRVTNNQLSKLHIYGSHKTLGACRKNTKEGFIEISGNDTVEKLERTLWDEYGLSAEVFRKSGNLWIETSLSNAWTLNLQNEEGRMFSDGDGKK